MKRKLPEWCMVDRCKDWQIKQLDNCCDNCDFKQTDGIVEEKQDELEIF